MADPISLIFFLVAGATVAYGIKKILDQIDWGALRRLVRRVADGLSAEAKKLGTLLVSVAKKGVTGGLAALLFGKQFVFYMFASVFNSGRKVVYNWEKKRFNSLSEIRDSAIREAVETTGAWSIQSAISG